MPLLDRFRARPAWQSRDAETRVAAVRELAADQQDVLGEIARTDEDPRVRRAAVKRLVDPVALAQCVQGDGDEGVRTEAMELLLGMAVNGQEGGRALQALEGLKESKHLVAAAREARLADVRLAALGRLSDARSLASLARKSDHPAVRLQALAAIEDPSVLLDLALKSEHKDVAVASLERLTDDAAVALVVEKGRNKAAVRRARALLDERRPPVVEPEPVPEAEPVAEAEEAVAPEPPPTVTAPEAEEREALCRRLERLPGDVVATELPALR